MVKRLLNHITHRIYTMPVLVLMPHSSCNCRCVMCDIWKANHNKRELTEGDLQKHLEQFRELGVREIVFSGGEPLMHANLWRLCEMLKEANIRLTLLSTGLLLTRNSSQIVNHFDEVIVSVDGSEDVHNRIRNIPGAFQKLADGVASLKHLDRNFKISARCVIQRHNYADFVNIVKACRDIGLDRVSFLAADISTAAFNRHEPWTDERVTEIALSRPEVVELEKIITDSFRTLRREYDRKFIAETPRKILSIVEYYRAINGEGEFPERHCNAPWVSAVIESDGSVQPCFFHPVIGNIRENDFKSIINSPSAIAFRKKLDVKSDPICRKCVCTLKLGWRQPS